MEILVKSGDLEGFETAVIVINVFEESAELDRAVDTLDRALNGQIRQVMDDGDFQGKANETALLYTNGKIPAKRVLLVGLGKKEEYGLETIRTAAASAAIKVRDLRIKNYSTLIPNMGQEESHLSDRAQAVVEGAILALYTYDELKTETSEDRKEVNSLTILVFDEAQLAEVEGAAETGRQITTGVNLVRDLVNRPANHATPTILAQQAKQVAREFGLTFQVLAEEEMQKLGMGSLLAVAQGTEEPAKLVILEYNGDRDDLDTIALVGKGITFDSGGISLKQAEGMKVCKGDMAGAAAVLGTMRVVAALNLPVHVVGLMPLAENMPGGRAYKPGDVVKAMNGKTIEVISTDAEGRMILVDALSYAVRYEPEAIIDLATLTGSVMVALGHQAMGLFSNDDDLSERLEAAGQKSFERVWRFPLFEEYGKQLKSDIADMKHAGGREGGAITAAFFLQEFVNGLPWAHLDIAGTAFKWSEKDRADTPYLPSWATGIGVRLLTQFLRDWVSTHSGS
jgi:leucyl aminopeptidase